MDEGPGTVDEEYQHIEAELERIQNEMEAILETTVPGTDQEPGFRQILRQHTQLFALEAGLA